MLHQNYKLFPEQCSIDKRVEVEQEILLLSESKIWVRFPHPDVQSWAHRRPFGPCHKGLFLIVRKTEGDKMGERERIKDLKRACLAMCRSAFSQFSSRFIFFFQIQPVNLMGITIKSPQEIEEEVSECFFHTAYSFYAHVYCFIFSLWCAVILLLGSVVVIISRTSKNIPGPVRLNSHTGNRSLL